MDSERTNMDAPRQAIVLQTIQQVCTYRGWSLLAVHVRTTHVHVVVHANQAPEKIMNDCKAYASRNLTAAGFEQPERKRWTRHGSTRYLWQPEHVEAAIRYVVDEQGEPMVVYENKERTISYAPATFANVLRDAGEIYTVTPLLELPAYQISDTDSPNPDRQGGPSDAHGTSSLTVAVSMADDAVPNPDRQGGMYDTYNAGSLTPDPDRQGGPSDAHGTSSLTVAIPMADDAIPNSDHQGGQPNTGSLTVAVPMATRNSPLSTKERQTHEDGLVTVLRLLHDELDAAVADAYGWPVNLSDADILQRLVHLNTQRTAEEAQGHIRWLRPTYQAARAGLPAAVQEALVEEDAVIPAPVAVTATPWPDSMPAQAAAVRGVLERSSRPLSPAEVAGAFGGPTGKRAVRVAELLDTLATLGQAVVTAESRYAAG